MLVLLLDNNNYQSYMETPGLSNDKVDRILVLTKKVEEIIRTYAEEENCEAIFRRSGSEFIILRIQYPHNPGRKMEHFRTKKYQ
jgi:hypothetical protein